ncbi:MAG: secondary thiamine-phosphate synthase enzyme YjbQ [Mailhella sp.]|nr:secondary thiamine-phosphate synthase enzyme YjbQ [Mailhella sp.]
MKEIIVKTTAREQMIDITRDVIRAVHDMVQGAGRSGAVMLYCPHTTCGLTINEGYDPDVVRDMTRFFSELAPLRNGWLHAEGNSDAHIKSSLLGSSLLIPLEEGEVRLGTWQAVYLYEGDGPRTRTVQLRILADA